MAAVSETNSELRDTDGFLVESPEGEIGWVEERRLSNATARVPSVASGRDQTSRP